MELLRLYCDESGESHFDTIEVPISLHNELPPTKTSYFSEPSQAKRWVFCRCPVGWDGKLHPSSRRQIVASLTSTVSPTALEK